MTVAEILKDTETRMRKSIESAQADFATLRTGRANPALLDSLKVEYYGQLMPVNQLGTVTAPEPRVLLISPWDRAAIPIIERAISNSNLGLAPNNDGTSIRLNIPMLTQERRKEFVKQLAQKGEAGRVALRNIRRDAIETAKKDEEITDDEAKRAEKDVQKIVDRFMAELDAHLKQKETELLED
jgi:ribosome recycling factor